MLIYCDRYYNSQFITRKTVINELLSKFEKILNHYFEADLATTDYPKRSFSQKNYIYLPSI